MMNYFKDCTTLEELKSTYKKLVFQHHPDRGGDHETMVKINLQYEKAFEVLKNVHKKKDGTKYTKPNNNEKPQDFINLINELLKMYGLHIEVIGSFVWVSGDTKPHKEALKKLGFRWHTAKKVWYKAPDDYIKRSRTKYTMNEVRNMYGVQYEADANKTVLIEG